LPITKEQILKGKRYTEEVKVKGYDEPFLVRPLTDGEYAEVKAVALRNTRLKPDGSIDWESTQIADVTKSQAEARFLTVSYGLSVDEIWAPEDVKVLKPGTLTRPPKSPTCLITLRSPLKVSLRTPLSRCQSRLV